MKVLTDSLIKNIKAKVPKLYSAYGTNTDGSLTQSFINGKLNASELVLGTGAKSNASKTGQVALGWSSEVNGDRSIAIGTLAKAVGDSTVSIGNQASGEVASAVIVGASSGATYAYTTAVGSSAWATGQGGTALGFNTSAGGSDSVAVGAGAGASLANTIAVGHDAKATKANSMAFGWNATTEKEYQVSFGSGTNSAYNHLISHIKDGVADDDAVTVGQLKSMSGGGGGGSDWIEIPTTWKWNYDVYEGTFSKSISSYTWLRVCAFGPNGSVGAMSDSRASYVTAEAKIADILEDGYAWANKMLTLVQYHTVDGVSGTGTSWPAEMFIAVLKFQVKSTGLSSVGLNEMIKFKCKSSSYSLADVQMSVGSSSSSSDFGWHDFKVFVK